MLSRTIFPCWRLNSQTSRKGFDPISLEGA
jgi:hypothetical protein